MTHAITRYLRFFLISALLITGLSWLITDFLSHERNISARRAEFEITSKNLLQQQVENTMDYINYMRSTTDQRLRDTIQHRTQEAHALARHLHALYLNKLPKSAIQTLILEALRSIRYHQERGYFFATRLDGVELLFTDRPQLEGKNLIDMKDSQGKFVIREMIQLAKTKGEGFIEYTWTKPHTAGNNHLKISYIKYFAPLGFFIGTGEYLSDVETDIKAEILSRIEKIRFGNNGYIFGGTFQGLSLSGPAKGQNMYATTDINGVKVVEELIKAAKLGGGFVSYVMPALEGKKSAPKLSFVTPLHEWNWYIGSGMYMDELDNILDEIDKIYHAGLIKHILLVLFLLALTWTLSILFIKKFSSKITGSIHSFEHAFQNAALLNIPMESQNFVYEEFFLIAQAANKVMEEQVLANEKLEKTSSLLSQLVDEQNFVLSHMQDFVYSVNRSGTLIYISPSVKLITGYDSNDQYSVLSTYLTSRFQSVLASGPIPLSPASFPPYELEIPHQDGHPLVLEINENPYEEKGEFAGLICVARDITARKATEKQLKLTQFAIEKIALEIYWLDQNAKIIYVNDFACRNLGYSREELLYQPISLFDPNYIQEKWEMQWKKNQDRSLHLQSIHLRKDQSTYPVEVKVTSFDYEGLTYYFAFISDISERIKTQEFLIQTEKMASLGTLAAGTAHEINNPLGIILQALQNVKRRLNPDFAPNQEAASKLALDLSALWVYMEERKISYYLESIKQAGERASKIVTHMLSLSHKDSAGEESFDINHIVESALELANRDYDLSKKYDFQHIQIEKNLSPGPIILKGNPTELEQVILNLLKNASQALYGDPVKTPRPQISILTSIDKQQITMEVKDNGPGIPPEIQKHLFEPFFTTKPVGEGTGLGLSLAYFIITEKYRGQIKVSSSKSTGTCFSLIIPLRDEKQ